MGQIVVVYIYHLFTTDVSRRYSTNGDGLDNLLQSLQIPFSQPVIRKCPIYQICERAKVKIGKKCSLKEIVNLKRVVSKRRLNYVSDLLYVTMSHENIYECEYLFYFLKIVEQQQVCSNRKCDCWALSSLPTAALVVFPSQQMLSTSFWINCHKGSV